MLGVVTLTFLVTASVAPDAALLSKLAEHDARPAEMPLRVELTQDELDAQGKTEKTSHEVRKREGDKLVLVEATVDGKDVLEKVRASEAKKASKQKSDGVEVSVSMPSPFGASQQPLYTFTATPVGTNGAQVRVDFVPKGKKSEQLSVGFAVIDLADAEVVSMSMHPSVNPTFVDEMQVDIAFVRGPNGYRPATMVTKGDGGFLFIRKRVRATEKYSY